MQLGDRGRERVDVPRRNHAAGAEAANRLGQPRHVVGDGRDTRAERPQQRPALVDLRAVREDGDGGLAERVVDLGRGQVAEPPLGAVAGCAPVGLDRLERLAGDEEAGAVGALDGLDRVAESLVGPDHPEREHGSAVVAPRRVAGEDGMGDHPQSAGVDAEVGQRLAAALAVHDDAVEAAEQAAPELELRRPSGAAAGRAP